MTTHRRYSFSYPDPWDKGHDRVQRVLEQACAARWWFQDPEVTGAPFQRLQFSFTASGRDQWWTHRRALDLAVDCFIAAGLRETDVPLPEWEPLEPHTNRGRWRTSAA